MKPINRHWARSVTATCAILIATTQLVAAPTPNNADAASPETDLARALVRMREIPTGRHLWAFAERCRCVKLKVVDSIVARSDAIVDPPAVRQPLYGETRTNMSSSSFRAQVRISRLALRDGVAPLTLYHELRHVVISHAEWRAARSRPVPRSGAYEARHARVDTYSDSALLAFIARVPEVRQILASKGVPRPSALGDQAPLGDGQTPPPLPPGGGSGPL
jgi:hypothetical protein